MDSNTYILFQQFNDQGLAEEMTALIKSAGIKYKLTSNATSFDPTYNRSELNTTHEINLMQQDFNRAHQVLDEFYMQQLKDIKDDYYVYEYTNTELLEIIDHSDEWSKLDFLFAKQLLEKRGIVLNEEKIEQTKKNREKELLKPENAPQWIILSGYLASILGGLLGFMIGWQLHTSQKILPDGRRLYTYSEAHRKHGFRMVLISIAFAVILILYYLLYSFLD
jgi:hypothetical protein